MSRNQRLGLAALAIAVAVAAFVILKPAGDDAGQSSSSPSTETTSARSTTPGSGNATTAEQPATQRVVIKGGKPDGGVRSLKFEQGTQVRFEVSADSAQTLHLHGYEIEGHAMPGKPAVFKFRARNEGAFELESHTAEDQGLEPVMARIVIEPS